MDGLTYPEQEEIAQKWITRTLDLATLLVENPQEFEQGLQQFVSNIMELEIENAKLKAKQGA